MSAGQVGKPISRVLGTITLLAACQANIALADDFPESYIRAQLQKANAGVEVNLGGLQPGKYMQIEYADRPILIYRRTPEDLKYLRSNTTAQLADPAGKNWAKSIAASHRVSTSKVWARLLAFSLPSIEKTSFRSLQDEYLVIGAWSPHSGCRLQFVETNQRTDKSAPFFDSCRGIWFDVAGRVLKAEMAVPAQQAKQFSAFNLDVPPYYYRTPSRLTLGPAKDAILPNLDISAQRSDEGLDANERLISAAGHNDMAGVKAALQSGAKADFYMPGKGSPLDAAIVGGSMGIIELLVAKGARPTPNSRNSANFVKRQDVLELINRLEKR
ncbi:hypothetical protein [Pseudoduganella sp. HUAS MS19]